MRGFFPIFLFATNSNPKMPFYNCSNMLIIQFLPDFVFPSYVFFCFFSFSYVLLLFSLDFLVGLDSQHLSKVMWKLHHLLVVPPQAPFRNFLEMDVHWQP